MFDFVWVLLDASVWFDCFGCLLFSDVGLLLVLVCFCLRVAV